MIESTAVTWALVEMLSHQASDFWDATLQNWQSEFLAVGSMVMRRRGSSRSRPVGARHHATAEEG